MKTFAEGIHVIKRMICFLFLLLIFIGVFQGCAEFSLETQLLNDDATDMINESFYNQNHTYGAYYKDSDTELNDASYPGERTFLITSQDVYDQVFASNVNLNVDFSFEMLVVYTFTAKYVRDMRIDEVLVDGQKLYINLSMIKPKRVVMDAVMPYQRYVVIKLEKADISEVEINID